MSVRDANFGSPVESSVSAAWVDRARASILAEGKQFTRINVGTEPSWLGGVSLEDKSFKPGIWSLDKEEKFGKNTPESQAAKALYEHMPPEKRAQLDKEMAQYEKEVKSRGVMIGINIKSPEPGPVMKEFQKQVDGVVRQANEQVDSQMTAFEKELLANEKQKYQDELDQHRFDANINYRLPEPGKMMQERARRVREAINKIAGQSQTPEAENCNQPAEPLSNKDQTDQKDQKNSKDQKDQATTSDTWSAVKSKESVWARLGFTSPDVLAFDQEAPSRAESKLGKVWEDIKDLFGQSDTVNDRLKQAVESKLTPQERVDLAKQEKEFHKKQMDSLTTGIGWAGDGPDLVDYPLIGKRDQMLRDAEQHICKDVRSHLTQAEKVELDNQFLQYAEAMRTYRESPVFKPRPQPGQAIRKFYKSVGDAVENYGKQQAA